MLNLYLNGELKYKHQILIQLNHFNKGTQEFSKNTP